MKTQARSITTNQVGVHEDLIALLVKHQQHAFKRPIAEHTQNTFNECVDWLGSWAGEVIIDACCGVGESTTNIAKRYPHAKIIGIDKSVARLDKHHSYKVSSDVTNYILVQADLNDFWRLLTQYVDTHKPIWQITKQYILYPNPYPKKSQLSKRWHASALFPYIMQLSANIELRSNWRLYLEEFLVAAQHYGHSGDIEIIDGLPITPFERKYQDAGQTCFKLAIRASGCDK